MPESVVEIKELKILIDILNFTIFEKLKFNLFFRGYSKKIFLIIDRETVSKLRS